MKNKIIKDFEDSSYSKTKIITFNYLCYKDENMKKGGEINSY